MRPLGALIALSLLLTACRADQTATPSQSPTSTPVVDEGGTQVTPTLETEATATVSAPEPPSPGLPTPTSPFTATLQIAELPVVALGAVNQVAWSPDGGVLAAATSEGVHLYDGQTREKLDVLDPTMSTFSLDFSPDGKVLVVGGLNSTISWWDPAEGHYLGAFQGHLLGVTSIDFGPSGRILASGSDDGTVRIWSTALAADPGFISDQTLTVYKQATNRITQIAFSQDEGTLAVATYGGVHWVDVGSWETLEIYSGHPGLVTGFTLSPDGRWLASAGADGFLRTWYLFGEGSHLSMNLGLEGRILSLSYSPDGDYFAAGDINGRVLLWVTKESGAVGTELDFRILGEHRGPITSLAFHPDGAILASSSDDGVVKLWKIPASGE